MFLIALEGGGESLQGEVRVERCASLHREKQAIVHHYMAPLGPPQTYINHSHHQKLILNVSPLLGKAHSWLRRGTGRMVASVVDAGYL